ANNEGRAPVKGADNLYVYDSSTGKPPVFIADLCSGPELSGGSKDVRCPSNLEGGSGKGERNDAELWLSSAPNVQTAGEGRFLVFSSYGRLLTGDVDTARDVYRYDAANGTLNRVSIGEAGNDANGNNSAHDASIEAVLISEAHAATEADLRARAVSEDGTRIVFTTADPLSPEAINGLENAYEWRGQ